MLTVKQLAERWNVSEDYIYKLVRKEAIPFYRIEKLIRFDEAEIAAYERENYKPVKEEINNG